MGIEIINLIRLIHLSRESSSRPHFKNSDVTVDVHVQLLQPRRDVLRLRLGKVHEGLRLVYLITWAIIGIRFLPKMGRPWPLFGLFSSFQTNITGVVAIAPWFRLRLPSCGPGFESQAHQLCFFQLLKL